MVLMNKQDELKLKIAVHDGYLFTGAEFKSFEDMCKKLRVTDEKTVRYYVDCIDNPYGEGILVNKLNHGIWHYSEWQVGVDDYYRAFGKEYKL